MQNPKRFFVQANPGFYLVRPQKDENHKAGGLWKVPIIAWYSFDSLNERLYPVTAEGIPDRNKPYAIEYPSGATDRFFDLLHHAGFETEEDLIAAFNRDMRD